MRESGWSSGKRLEFYSTNPGSTPVRVKYPKNDQKTPSVPLMTADLQGVLKKDKGKEKNI